MHPAQTSSLKGNAFKRALFAGGLGVVILIGTVIVLGAALPPAKDQLQADQVNWARLITPDKDWDIHGDRDPNLAEFIRANTSLNLWRSFDSANPTHLELLCRHPFIYAKDLRHVRDTSQLVNIGEYLRRGGFICVDACATEAMTPDMEGYLRENSAIFKRIFPTAQIHKLPETHGIYTCYFKLNQTDVYTADMGDQSKCANYGLYGVTVGGRMVAVISMYGFECGWPQTPMRTSGCMKFILNMYVYAMTAGPER